VGIVNDFLEIILGITIQHLGIKYPFIAMDQKAVDDSRATVTMTLFYQLMKKRG